MLISSQAGILGGVAFMPFPLLRANRMFAKLPFSSIAGAGLEPTYSKFRTCEWIGRWTWFNWFDQFCPWWTLVAKPNQPVFCRNNLTSPVEIPWQFLLLFATQTLSALENGPLLTRRKNEFWRSLEIPENKKGVNQRWNLIYAKNDAKNGTKNRKVRYRIPNSKPIITNLFCTITTYGVEIKVCSRIPRHLPFISSFKTFSFYSS